MKKALINISFLVFAIFAFKQTEAKAKFQITYIDTTTSDTVRFFRNLIKHQQKYQGQSFSVLLHDIPYTIKSYGLMIGSPLSTCPGIIISFLDNKTTFKEGNNNNKIAVIEITWGKVIPTADIQKLKLINPDGWGSSEINYFSPIIVQSIDMWK